MNRHSSTNQVALLAIFSLAGLCSLAGCAGHNYKKEADEQAYRIVDQKWRAEYGDKANYKISDVEPSPNDIRIEKVVAIPGVLTLPRPLHWRPPTTANIRDKEKPSTSRLWICD